MVVVILQKLLPGHSLILFQKLSGISWFQLCKNTKVFSLLLDCSTDAANVDNELYLAVWFDKDGLEERVCTKTSYLKISKLPDTSAMSLFSVLQEALKILGITKINRQECEKLIGIATDGASANIVSEGLSGKGAPLGVLDVVFGSQVETSHKRCFKAYVF